MKKLLLPLLALLAAPALATNYTISNLEELQRFMQLVHNAPYFEGDTVKLTADIDCQGGQFTSGYSRSGTVFKGTFDGQGHKIHNFSNKGSSPGTGNEGKYGVAMFDIARDGAVIKNLTLEGDFDDGAATPDYAAAFAAYAIGKTDGTLGLTLENCHFKGRVSNYRSAAAFVGVAVHGSGAPDGQVLRMKNCTAEATVVSDYSYVVGGLVANGEAVEATDCSFEGAATGRWTLGGLVGRAVDSSFARCSFEGTMGPGPSGNGNNCGCGGLVGYASNAVFRACAAAADITWGAYVASEFTAVGGAAGLTLGNSAFYDCSATNSVTVPYGRVGGFVGWTAGAETFSNCTAQLTLELTNKQNSLVSGGFAASVASAGALFVDCSATAQGNDLKAGFYENQEPKGQDVKVGRNTFRRCHVVDSTAKEAGFCEGAWNCSFEGCTVRGGSSGYAGFVYSAGRQPDNQWNTDYSYEQTSTYIDCSVHGTRARNGFVTIANYSEKNGHTNVFRRCRTGCIYGDSNLSGAESVGFGSTLNKGTLVEDCVAYGIADMGDFNAGFAASVSSGTTIRRSVAAAIPSTTDNRTAGFAYTLYSGAVVEDCYAVYGPVSSAVYGNGYYDYQQGYQGGFVRSCRIGQAEGSSPIRRSFALWPVPATTCPYVGSFAAVTPYSDYSTDYFEDCYRPAESPIGDCNNADADGVEALSRAEFATATAATMPNYDFANVWYEPGGAASSPYLDASVDGNGDFWFLAAVLGAEGRILVDGEAPKEAYPAGAVLTVQAVADNPDLPFAGWIGDGFADPSAPTTTYTVKNVSAIAAKFCIPIYTVDDWTNMVHGIGGDSFSGTEAFALMNDLDFTDYIAKNGWNYISPSGFYGKFFGQGHTIRGLVSTNGYFSYTHALFEKIENGAEIRDLTVESAVYPGSGIDNDYNTVCMAGLVCDVGSGCLISNCHTRVDCHGQFPPWADSYGYATSKYYGLARNVNGTGIRIIDCTAEGTMIGCSEVAGLIGYADITGSEIARCSAMGYFCATNSRASPYGRVSGLVGELTLRGGSTVRECFTAGIVDGAYYGSGFAHKIELCDDQSTVRDCYSTAEVVTREGGGINDYGNATGFAQRITDNNDEGGVTIANCWFGGTARALSGEYGQSFGFTWLTDGDVAFQNCAFVQSGDAAEEMEGTAGVTAIAKADRLSAGPWAGYDLRDTWTMTISETTPYFAWSVADGDFRVFAMDETPGTAISHPDAAEAGRQAAVAGDADRTRVVDTWKGAAGFADANAPETTFLADNHRTLRCTWKSAGAPDPWASQTVTFNANGGSPATQSKDYTPSGRYSPLADAPTLADCVFGGWFTLPEGGTQVTTNMTVSTAATRTFYAHWRAFQTVSFDPNGGTCGTAEASYEVGFAYGTMPAPSRTGWHFLGWFDAAEGGTQVSPALVVGAPGARTVYAHWSANQYAVELTRVSGSGGTTAVTATFASPMPAIKPPTGYTGHTFQGYWSGRNGAGTKYYNGDGTSARDWDIASNTNLFGYWTANQYTATFDKQGGTGGPANATVTYDQLVPAVTIPTRTGYDFLGYYTEPNGQGTQYWSYNGSANQYWNLTENKTFYASWCAKYYSVSFDKQDGSGGWSSAGVYYGDWLPDMTSLPTRSGYTFGGYFSEPNGGGTQYYAADGTALQCWTQDANGRLYAKWTANGDAVTVTVTLNRQSGTGGTASVTATVGAALPAISVPTRSGYTFGGYFTAANGGGTQYYSASGTGVRNWDKDVATTLYAKWTANGGGGGATTYRVVFNANGGTGTMAAQTIARDATAALSANAFTRAGWVFLGWAKTATGAVAYTDGAAVRNLAAAGGSTTVYAKWAKQKYKVKFCHTYKGEKGKMKAQTFTYGTAKKLSKNKFKREGYAFKGWATSKSKAKKGKVKYKNKKKVKNLTATGKTVKLYAVWKKKK